jgi:hypothetical protein
VSFKILARARAWIDELTLINYYMVFLVMLTTIFPVWTTKTFWFEEWCQTHLSVSKHFSLATFLLLAKKRAKIWLMVILTLICCERKILFVAEEQGV